MPRNGLRKAENLENLPHRRFGGAKNREKTGFGAFWTVPDSKIDDFDGWAESGSGFEMGSENL